MHAPDTYSSIAAESHGYYREKASKFISFAFPVTSEQMVKDHLQQLRKKYHDADHYCFASQIGFPESDSRTSDDGEPAGSAGKPILGQILSRGLCDILVVVIRYFGGTRLGIPGLINAYRCAARDALDHSTTIFKVLEDFFEISFPYESLNPVMQILKKKQAVIKHRVLDQVCTLQFSVRKSQCKLVINKLNTIRNIYVYQISS
jgi:uncharacterized YigZ family protein